MLAPLLEQHGKLSLVVYFYYMKYILSILVVAFFTVLTGCHKPFVEDIPKVKYVDILDADTIVINYNASSNSMEPHIYYARKNWQTIASPAVGNGSRFVAVRSIDSVYLTPIFGGTANEVYYFRFNSDGSQLQAQNMLVAPSASSTKTFKKQ